MALNLSIHRNIQLQILKDIYSDTSLAPYLGFQGGTAAFLFYDLERGSVDLDFDLLDTSKEKEIFEKILKIAQKYGEIKDSRIKRFNLIVVLSYELKAQNVKIEINRNPFSAQYELKTLLGISMLVMVKADMFANKLMAMHDRIGRASRDVFDVYFFAKNNWPINKELVEKRAGVPFRKMLEKCVKLLEKMDNKIILSGLGELLTESQKDWVKTKLKDETIFLLKLALENA